ncbi:MAG: YbgA family protein [Arcobacter sp.]|nr:YbgA family protein [Arcobacter sp.]
MKKEEILKDLDVFYKQNPNLNALIKFHSSYKYLIYAKSHKSYKELGQIVANHHKKDISIVLKEYKKTFLKTIDIQESIPNTYNVLLHIFGYFKKFLTKEEKAILLEKIEKFKKDNISLENVNKDLEFYINKYDISYLKNQKFFK